MADKIFIEVEVDDKGASARVTNLDKAIDGLTQRAKQASPAVDAAANSTQRAGTAAASAELSWRKLTSATFLGVSANQAVTASLQTVYSIISSGLGIVGSAIAQSQKYTNAFMGLNSVAVAYGQSAGVAKTAAQELAADGLMSVAEAAEGLKNLLSKGLNMEQSVQVMRSLKDTAAFGRQGMLELGQAVVGATQGIRNGMSAMSDNAGVAKNLSVIYKEAGIKAGDLGMKFTDTATAAKFMTQWLKETQAQTGDAARLAETYTGQLAKMNTSWNVLLSTMGAAITENKTVADAMGFVTDAIQGVIASASDQGEAFKVVSEIVIFFVGTLGDASLALNVFINFMFDAKTIVDELGAAITNLRGMYVSMNVAYLSFSASTAIGAEKQKFLNGELAKAQQELADLEKSYNEQTEAINRHQASQAKWTRVIAEGGERLKQLAVDLEKTKGLHVEFGASTARVTNEAVASEKATKEAMQEAAKAAKMAADDKAEAWKKTADWLDFMGMRWMKEAEETAKRATELREFVQSEIEAIDASLRSMGQRFENPMDDVSKSVLFQNFTLDPGAGREASATFGAAFKDGLRSGLADTADLIIDVIVNGGDLRRGAVALASKFGAALGGSIGEYFGGPVGRAVGEALGSLAGPALDKMIGVFTGPSAEADIKRRVSRSWGVAISDGLSEAIATLAKKVGRQAAEILSIDKILSEAGGLNAGNLQAFTARFRDVFVMFETGAISSAQAVEVLNTNWMTFARAHTDSSGRISDQMKEMIRLAREMGLEVQAINDYLWDQAKVAIEGSNAIIAGSTKQFESYAKIADGIRTAQEEIDKLNQVEARGRGVEWTEQMAAAQAKLTAGLTEQHKAAEGAGAELANLGTIAVATYAAAIASGMSHAAALKAASPGLSQLQKAYADLGLNIEDAGLKALIMQNELLTKNPALMAGIDGLSQSFIALSNMGLLNAETFSSMQKAGETMYQRLLKEAEGMGGSAKDALIPMQAYLHEAEKQAKLLGIPLDANTQAMIDQSKALGIWKDAGKDANAVLLDGLKDIVDAMREMIGLLKSVPPEVNTRVTVTRETVDVGGNGGPVFHSGGLISGGRAPSNRIADVSITAQQGEYVVSRKGVSAVGVRALDAINQGNAEGAGLRKQVAIEGDVHVHGNFESDDDAADAIGRAMVQRIKARGVRFGRRRY